MKKKYMLFIAAIIVMTLFPSFSWSAPEDFDITVSEGSVYKPDEFWVDNALKAAFKHYWSSRIEKNAEVAFKLEAPHFQEMVNYQRYKNYAQSIRSDLSRIIVKNRKYLSKRLLVISCSLKAENREIDILDRWLLLDGKWYHLPKDPIFFPGVQ